VNENPIVYKPDNARHFEIIFGPNGTVYKFNPTTGETWMLVLDKWYLLELDSGVAK
jgi:hypothetical protein